MKATPVPKTRSARDNYSLHAVNYWTKTLKLLANQFLPNVPESDSDTKLSHPDPNVFLVQHANLYGVLTLSKPVGKI